MRALRCCITPLAFASILAGPVRAALPDLAPVALEVPAEITAAPNPVVQVAWAITNQGDGEATGYWYDILYFSTSPLLDNSAVNVSFQSSPSVVEPGDTYWYTNSILLPVTQSGTYYLIAKANAYNYFEEISTANNVLAIPFNFQSTPADLAPHMLIVPAEVTGPPKPSVTIIWGITNQGPGQASGWWSDTLLFSTNETPNGFDLLVLESTETGTIPPGGIYWRTNFARLPVVQSGNYFLTLEADRGNSLYETVTNNNRIGTEVTVNVLFPDLAPLGFLVPQSLTGAPNPYLTLVWGVTNQGAGAAIPDNFYYDQVYISTNAALDTSAVQIYYQFEWGSVPAGGRYWRTNNVRIPVVDSGGYYLIFCTDAQNTLYESNFSNNAVSVPVQFTIRRPDLVPGIQVPTTITGPPFPDLNFVFGATNIGAGDAMGGWVDMVSVSPNPSGDPQAMGYSYPYYANVAPQQYYWRSNTIRLPFTQDGTYYLRVALNINGDLVEADQSNNVVTVPFDVHIVPPDLTPVSLQLPTVLTCPPNAQLTMVWGIKNQGAGAAIGVGNWTDKIYVSTNSVWDATATELNSSYETGPIAPGETYWRTNTFPVRIVQSGAYYFFLRADAYNYLIERDETNNQLTLPVAVVIQPPDLVPLVSQIPPDLTCVPYPHVNLVWGVTNQGPGLAQGFWSSWADAVYFSANPVLDNQALDVSGSLDAGPLASGSAYWRTNTVLLPVTNNGTFYLIFKADRYDNVYESDETNNAVAVPVAFTVLPSDLTPIQLQVPTVITGPPNPLVTVVWGVTNLGAGQAELSYWTWYDTLYLSRNALLDGSDIQVGYSWELGPVAAGGSYWRTNTMRFPVVANTNYFLIFAVDSGNAIYESNETNNLVAIPVQFNILSPDLAPIALVLSNSIVCPPNPLMTFSWGVTNRGAGPAEVDLYSYWSDRVYISTNSVWDNTATALITFNESSTLPSGGSYWWSQQITVPVFQSGTYYFFLITDANRTLYESDFGNNITSVPVTFTVRPADLAPIALHAPTPLTCVPNPRLTVSWGVTNGGIGPAIGQWTDSLFFSSLRVLDSSASRVGTFYEGGPVENGTVYWRTNTVSIPVTQSGTYYLYFVADEANSIFESNPNNNTRVVPITLTVTPPDLAPETLVAPDVVVGPPNPYVTFVWAVTNQGPGAASAYSAWPDRLYLCNGPTLDSEAVELANALEYGPFEPGATYWRTNQLRVPVVQDGSYFFVFTANADNSLFETSFANNQTSRPVTFHIQPPDLAPILFQSPAQISGAPNPTVRLTWGVTNQGSGTALGFDNWMDEVYLSSDPVLDPGDLLIASSYEVGPVSPGGNYWRTQTVRLPLEASGGYYLIFSVDANQEMHDSDYRNNTTAVPISFSLNPPDLAPIAFTAPAVVNDYEFPSVTLVWGVTNRGTGPAVGSAPGASWADAVFLTTDPLQPWWFATIAFEPIGETLQPGGSYWRTNTVRLPISASGQYYFVLNTDANNAIYEANETNNSAILPVSFNISLPDLVPGELAAPTVVTGSPNPTFTISYAITNLGPGYAVPDPWWYDRVFLSTTNVWDETAVPVAWFEETNHLAPQAYYSRTNTITVPAVSSGNYYLWLLANGGGLLPELDYSNNLISVPVELHILPPDLAVLDVRAPSNTIGYGGTPFSVTWCITNQGPGTATGLNGWWDSIYLSPVPFIDTNVFRMSLEGNTNTLPPGDVCWLTNRVQLPHLASGHYYLLFEANSGNFQHETNLSNNLAVVAFDHTYALPDLAPVWFQGPAVVTGPPRPMISLSWGITNQGLAMAGGSGGMYGWGAWGDGLYISRTTLFDDNAILLQTSVETEQVAPSSTYWRTNTVQLPDLPNGQYYMLLVANQWQGMPEINYSNNIAIFPIFLDLTAPDLAVCGFTAPSLVSGMPEPEITVIWGVTNRGPGVAVAPLSPPGYTPVPLADGIYLSTQPTLGDIWYNPPIALWRRDQPVPPGTSYWQTNRIRIPIGNSGSYYLIFKTDAYDVCVETNKANNLAVLPITFHLSPPGDLAALSFVAPRIVTGNGNPRVTLAWEVANLGVGSLWGERWDAVILAGTVIQPGQTFLFRENNELAVGATGWCTNTVILPVIESGESYLTFLVDSTHALFDLDRENNSISVPITFDFSGAAAVILSNPEFIPGQGFRMMVYGVPGSFYTLQASTNLQNWIRVLDFVCSENPTRVIDPNASLLNRRFYRVGPLANPPALQLELTRSGTSNAPGLQLKIDGPEGIACRLEVSTNLVDWAPAAHYPYLVPPVLIQDSTSRSLDRRFYRVVQE